MAANRIKILAIDDKPDNLTVLKAVVGDALPGAQVFTAGGGQQGLALALAEDPDVILLDIVMPEMDGYEVCRRLKADARLKLIPVVFLTAIKTNKESRIKALEAGGEGFLPKPLEEAELIAQIRAMVKIKAANVALLAEQERLNLQLDERTHTLANETWEHLRTKKAREAAEADLRTSEARLRKITDMALGVVYEYRLYPDGRSCFPYSSEGMNDIYEVTPEQVREDASIVFGRIHPDDLKRTSEAIFESARTLKDFHCELRMVLPRQGLRWRVSQAKPQRLPDGSTLWYGTITDITERKLKEEALKQEQGLSQAVVESIPGTFYLLDEKGCYVRWNAYQRDEIVGKPEDQMAGTAALGTIHPDDRALVQARIENVLLRGADEVVEARVLLRGGPAYRWLAMTGRRMIVDGQPFLVGTGIDITNSKQKNQELVESKNFLESVIENVPLMIFLKEAKDLRFEILNRAGEELLGYDRKALLGKNDSDFFTPEQAAGFIAKDRQVLDGKAGFLDIPEEPISTAKKGDRLLHTRKICIRGADGEPKYLLGISEDITERKRAEKEQAEIQLQLQQSQKIESVGRLAGGVAHDFNNLLTAIGGYAGFLMRGLGKDDPKQEDVKEILAATERAAGLTRQLLAFSRKQILNTQVVDLNVSVAGVVKMLKRLIGEQVQIQTKFAAQACRAKVDPGQIDQVLVNLAVNARDAMPNGGVLTLETAIVTPDASFSLRYPGLPQGPLVCLTVRDTGCGLTAEAREHLFEPFFTTKEKGKGTGLGLSTVFGIVKQSGGEIEVESEPNQGTAFRMYFPCVDAPVSDKYKDKNKDKDKDSLPRGSETILLVEDEDILRRLTERLLKADGYTVITAADGKSALEAAQRHGRPVDLLVTDVVMPGMNGRELALELSKKKLAHRTLYMSGYTDEAISDHGVLEDGIAFIYKPFAVEALSAKLREVLDGPADKAKA